MEIWDIDREKGQYPKISIFVGVGMYVGVVFYPIDKEGGNIRGRSKTLKYPYSWEGRIVGMVWYFPIFF